MGAPNIVRGGSHSGNIAAHQLASSGLLDILSSDYYPASLLDAAFRIADAEDNAFTLAQAIRLVSKHPAQALGLDDRGVIAEGNAPTWCWRTVAASMCTSTMSGARERGSFNAGKTDLAGGALRLR
ncbi:metal-dependent hydrolase [Klebsiella variicola]|uniref:Metal-dependent hydrolase n=1 Tax=Klebsiella variicola TaxID=244366 RepID=A0A7H4MBL1_KLEVA|nr:metal-dependent hydrolase [Klebsiella variicola]